MKTKMLINAVESEEYRVAIVTDNVLDGFYIESTATEQKIGNIYKGTIERIEPSLQACFVNFGADKNGFLPSADIHPEYYHIPYDPSSDGPPPPLEKVLKKGQELLVQVIKEMPGRKGAHLTTFLSLAGRYLVLTPGREMGGVSKKIEDEKERVRLKSVMSEFTLPEGVGFIVRTAALKQNKRELSRDLNRLLRMWENIRKAAREVPPLTLIHKEQDVCLRTLRDYFTGEITEVLVDDKDTYANVQSYMKIISPAHQNRVKLYKDKRPIFDHYKIEEQIEAIYRSEVPLKSGGSIVIDQTEALISIDVNSGRGKSGKDIETTAFKTNTEAAVEVARQLRLRDMGGLVVIDFIDMRDKNHNRDVEKMLREEMKKDRAKTDMSHISKFGLLELSRQRLRPSIESRSYQSCPHCQGRGIVPSVESAAISFLRQIWLGITTKEVNQVRGILSLDVATYLQNKKRHELAELESRYGVCINLKGDPLLPPGKGQVEFLQETQPKENGSV
ncbi:S1 RNA binding domain protein [uncultured Desulfatiglans sp.]|uniref:Ribonuclease G n=1 Tax=Uncultured Desulfatiglans sp. TaxID=1748965 RepID=A0A653A338_UNCDX|nr:S1 RNA binding domain protein [uncultured Desulfatiglans sp.]